MTGKEKVEGWNWKAGLWAGALLVCLGAAPAAAQSTPPPNTSVMRTQVVTFETTMKTWLPRAKALARDLILLLIGIELAVSGAMWGLSRTGIDEIVYRLVVKTFVFALVLKIIQDTGDPSGYFNLEHIPNGFRAMAGTITGLPAPYPDDVMDLGFSVIGEIWNTSLPGGWLWNWFAKDLVLAANLIILISFGAVAIRLFIALLHSVLVVMGGLVMLGFAGFRGTASIADRYLLWALNVSIKLFFLDMLIALSQALLPTAYASMALSTFDDLLLWIVVSMSYMGLVLYVPSVAARMMTENLSIRIASAVSL